MWKSIKTFMVNEYRNFAKLCSCYFFFRTLANESVKVWICSQRSWQRSIYRSSHKFQNRELVKLAFAAPSPAIFPSNFHTVPSPPLSSSTCYSWGKAAESQSGHSRQAGRTWGVSQRGKQLASDSETTWSWWLASCCWRLSLFWYWTYLLLFIMYFCSFIFLYYKRCN